MDPQVVEQNKMMFIQYEARKNAKDDPVDWDEFQREMSLPLVRCRGVIGLPGMTTGSAPPAWG